MTILRLLGSSDDKEKIGIAWPEGPPLRWFRPSQVSGQRPETSSVQMTRIEETVKKSKSKTSRQRYFSSTGRTDAIGIGASDGCRMIRWPGNWHKSVRLWTSSEAPDKLMVSREALVHWTYCVPETMQVAQEPSLQHRLNR